MHFFSSVDFRGVMVRGVFLFLVLVLVSSHHDPPPPIPPPPNHHHQPSPPQRAPRILHETSIVKSPLLRCTTTTVAAGMLPRRCVWGRVRGGEYRWWGARGEGRWWSGADGWKGGSGGGVWGLFCVGVEVEIEVEVGIWWGSRVGGVGWWGLGLLWWWWWWWW